MRILRNVALTALVLALGVAFAEAQSLVEVAKKEKERRKKNKAEASRVITDRELTSSYGGLPPATSSTSSTQAAADDEQSATSTAGAEGEKQEEQDETKTQEYWQKRVQSSKDKIAKLEQQSQSDDWGQGQRVGVDPRGQNNLAQRQQVEQQLAAARSELEAIRAEARRAGVPPGWVR